jgi:hypothetical protein
MTVADDPRDRKLQADLRRAQAAGSGWGMFGLAAGATRKGLTRKRLEDSIKRVDHGIRVLENFEGPEPQGGTMDTVKPSWSEDLSRPREILEDPEQSLRDVVPERI